MYGATKDKDAALSEFQRSKTKNVFIGQIMSGGIGIELFKKHSTADKMQHMMFFENIWGLDPREQALGRNMRIGQKSKCRYIDLIIADTIDVKMMNRRIDDKAIADEIVERGIRGFLEGF